MRPALFNAPPQQNLLTPFAEPPALAGMDGTVPLHNMPAGNAVYLYNLIPSDYGLRLRDGYQEWAKDIQGGPVKSIIPFNCRQLRECRLFVSTSTGIFDVTVAGLINPPPVVTFGNTTEEAGYITYTHYTDPAGKQTLLLADSKNGMYEYDPTGPAWTKYTTEITGVDPAKVVFIANHKQRLWLIEDDAADAWYLPAGQKNGLATRFQFGSKMRHGGFLVGLYPWTIDGGAGVDDYLLAISKSGDVLAYQGSDPAFTTSWNLVGNWFIGEIPRGRRIAQETGGDTLILSAYGVISASSLLQGVDPSRIERDIAGKITNILRRELREKKDHPYWEIKSLTEEGVFAINVPRRGVDQEYIQFVLNVNRTTEGTGGGWGMWRGIPATAFEPWRGNAFFGTEDGRLCRMFGAVDNVQLVETGGFWDQNNWDQALWGGPLTSIQIVGVPIEFSILGRFTDFNVPAYYKQVQWIRPLFQSNNVVSWSAKAVYDFNLTEYLGTPERTTFPGGRWDVDSWDKAIWSGLQTVSRVNGGGGYGRSVAIALRGTAVSPTVLVNIEGAWQPWNIL